MQRILHTRTTRLPFFVSRSFSVTPTLWNKSNKNIDLTPFLKRNYLPNWFTKWNLHPTSKWHLKWVKPFCDVQFKSGLGFTEDNLQNIELLPEQRVFAECPARRDDIIKGRWDLKLEGVPVRNLGRVEQNVNGVFSQLHAVLQHSAVVNGVPVKRKRKRKRAEKGVDTAAMQLATLCGFNDGKQFQIGGLVTDFKFAGWAINCEADVYVARRNTGGPEQLVLIWEGNVSKNSSGGSNMTEKMLEASAAQIIGEMISVHYQNAEHKFDACEVYAIRLIDDLVAFFKMEMSAEQVEDVCDKGVIPNKALRV